MKNKKALIVGVANERSLAWAIAQKLNTNGFECAFTYQGETLERRVRPLAESIGSSLILPCDVTNDTEVDSVFETIRQKWGALDVLIHSVAFAERHDLEGRFLNTERAGFLKSMDISCYSLISLTKRAESLMTGDRCSVVTLTYHGAQKVIPNYNMMGVAKAALEASVRYLAVDLGAEKKITVNAISAGAVKTLAAAGIRDFRTLLAANEQKLPLRENISADDVGELAAFLCGPGGKHITGTTMYVDSGAHIMG